MASMQPPSNVASGCRGLPASRQGPEFGDTDQMPPLMFGLKDESLDRFEFDLIGHDVREVRTRHMNRCVLFFQ